MDPEQMLPVPTSGGRLSFCPTVTLADLRRAYTILALDHFDGNKTQAAIALGITVKTLYNKLDEYKVPHTFGPWQKGMADPSVTQAVASA